MSWDEDISTWAHNNDLEPKTVGDIAIKDKKTTDGKRIEKGWEPSKYKSATMKDALFDYLSKWNTLSVKTLPTPATASLRKNPSTAQIVKKLTKLSNGWKIWTVQKSNYTHQTIASNDDKYINYDDNTLLTSLKTHQRLIEKLKKLNG